MLGQGSSVYKPGDTLIGTNLHVEYERFSSLNTVLVVSVNRGQMGRYVSDGTWMPGIPAHVTLLTNNMQILHRDFTWVARNFKHVDE